VIVYSLVHFQDFDFLPRRKQDYMTRILLCAYLFILILSASAFAGERVLNSEPVDRYGRHYLKIDDRGSLWTAYYDLQKGIHIRNLSGEDDLVVNEWREPLSKGLAFDVQGDHAYAVWLEEAEGLKKIVFRATHDRGRTLSERVLLDDGATRPFSRLKVGSNSKGDVFILWYGDTENEAGRFHLYCVSSNDFGRTFSEVRNMTPEYRNSILPTLMVDEDNAYIFSYSRKGERIFMIFRKSSDGGRTWSDPVEIKETGVTTYYIKPLRVGARLHVYWATSYEGVPVLEGAYSDDFGVTWKTTTFEDTRGLIYFLRTGYEDDGSIYLTYFGKRSSPEKNNVFIISSADNGASWGPSAGLRHYPFEDTRAYNPAVYAGEGGEAVALWVDYRNIRSNLYMQYSGDYGKTWQADDIPLEEPGRYNSNMYLTTDNLLKQGDTYFVLAYRHKSDRLKGGGGADLVLIDFTVSSRGKK
jgi:hypothetical protein